MINPFADEIARKNGLSRIVIVVRGLRNVIYWKININMIMPGIGGTGGTCRTGPRRVPRALPDELDAIALRKASAPSGHSYWSGWLKINNATASKGEIWGQTQCPGAVAGVRLTRGVLLLSLKKCSLSYYQWSAERMSSLSSRCHLNVDNPDF